MFLLSVFCFVSFRCFVSVFAREIRLDIDILRGICSLDVPSFMRTKFIIIVDDPDASASKMRELNEQLRLAAGSNICRVRQNEVM